MRKHHQLSFLDITVKNLIPENDPLKILFESIDFSFLFDTIKDQYKPKGAHGYSPSSLLKAILLIYLGLANSERDLAFKVRYNARLAFLTSFSLGNTPSHATFHYFRKRLGPDTFLSILSILSNLIAQAVAIITKEKLSIDSTHIETFKSDKDAKWGAKEMNFFFGYKIHTIVTNTDPPIPISIEVTPGNRHDGKMLKPLVKKAKRIIPKDKSIKELLGDAIYDSVENLSFLEDETITPYIPENKRGRKNPITRGDVFITREGEIICKGGMRLLYWGYDKRRKRYKFRCPLVNKEGTCLFRDICWKTKYGPVFYLHEEWPVMDRVRVIRNSPKFKDIYKKRTHVERFFSIVKKSHKLLEVRVRGIREVFIHVVLSMSAYLLRLIAGSELKVGLLHV